MMIQPASGPGVCERARCRICPKPWVVIRPTRAPLDSSTALVATVVPWTTLRRSRGLDAGLVADPPHAGEHALGRVGGGRRRLDPPLAVVLVVDEEQVGERPSDVHAQPIRHVRSSLVTSHPSSRELGELASPSTPSSLQHLLRVGAHGPARGLPDRARRLAELRHHARHGHLAVDLVLVLHEQPALAEVRRRRRRPRRRRPARTPRPPSLTSSSSSAAVCAARELADDHSSSRSSFSPRAWWVAKRSSSPSSGRPMSAARRRHSVSWLAAITTHLPSLLR